MSQHTTRRPRAGRSADPDAKTPEQRDAEHREAVRAVHRRSHYNRVERVISQYEHQRLDFQLGRLPDLYAMRDKLRAEMIAAGQDV